MPDNHAGPAALVASGLRDQVERVVAALSRGRFSYCCELDLHEGIVQALYQSGLYVGPGQREVRLSSADRIDFLLPSGLGIEVKIKGQTSAVWRQLHRYAASDRVRALLLVTTAARHAAGAPLDLDGVPVHTFVLRGAW